MKLADLQNLAAFLDQEAADAARIADQLDRMQLSSSAMRLRAEYCTNSAIHVREMADGLTVSVRILSQLEIQP